jgi:DNA primase
MRIRMDGVGGGSYPRDDKAARLSKRHDTTISLKRLSKPVSGRIPQSFIDELMQRADIVEVVGARLQLRKAGREYKACCPFHGEKTPSFTVSPDKGFYHCFGCGAHGTALGFLMEHDRLDFVAAVEELASIYGLDVPREETAASGPPTAPVIKLLTDAAEFFQHNLKHSPAAIAYLRKRGLDGETAREFRIGYAQPGWDSLIRRFEGTATAEQLLGAGLAIARDGGGHYDRFRDRIMFPIRDARGRVVGFGGRVIGEGEPKYLNSPETAVFHKGQELYGLHEAKQAERRLERLLVVEGYMDVVSLAQHGIRNAVATLGTATTAEHIRRLFRVVPEVIFCFDGDRAGRSAAWRALQTCLPELRDGRQVNFLFLPDGEDPDTLVAKEGQELFATRLRAAMPLSEYLIQQLAEQTGADTLDARARLAELAKPLLKELPVGVYRELLTHRLAAAVGLRQDRLEELIGTGKAAAEQRPRGRAAAALPGSRPSLVRQAITLAVHYPGLAARVAVPPDLAGAGQRGVPLLIELLELARQNPNLSPGAIVERFRGRPEGQPLAELLTITVLGEAAAAEELGGSLRRIVDQARQERLESLVSKASTGTLSSDEMAELRGLRAGRQQPAAPGGR